MGNVESCQPTLQNLLQGNLVTPSIPVSVCMCTHTGWIHGVTEMVIATISERIPAMLAAVHSMSVICGMVIDAKIALMVALHIRYINPLKCSSVR